MGKKIPIKLLKTFKKQKLKQILLVVQYFSNKRVVFNFFFIKSIVEAEISNQQINKVIYSPDLLKSYKI